MGIKHVARRGVSGTLLLAVLLLNACQGYSFSGRWLGKDGDPSGDPMRAMSD